jgi:hypothetical protein
MSFQLSLLQNSCFRLRPSTPPSAQARPALFWDAAYQLRWVAKLRFATASIFRVALGSVCFSAGRDLFLETENWKLKTGRPK